MLSHQRASLSLSTGFTSVLHTCDKFKKGIREDFFLFQGGFSKMYRIYRKIVNSFQGNFLILLNIVCFGRNFRAHFSLHEDQKGFMCMVPVSYNSKSIVKYSNPLL